MLNIITVRYFKLLMDNVQLKTEIVCYCCTCVCVCVCTRELVYIGHNYVIKLEGILRDCRE